MILQKEKVPVTLFKIKQQKQYNRTRSFQRKQQETPWFEKKAVY
ncbi:hypothetical protein CHK_2265 [Christensenella hongkongensis]|uniref:Uncharacterized protein n=1 Tax=Christensenella hongkongensis TaxID=270498 RepID=A0A0M2NIE2_9FIRM|nr:hypothetical protein CHK_2265 [Christensenella hongkongensis]